jgi:hypothetical protein
MGPRLHLFPCIRILLRLACDISGETRYPAIVVGRRFFFALVMYFTLPRTF